MGVFGQGWRDFGPVLRLAARLQEGPVWLVWHDFGQIWAGLTDIGARSTQISGGLDLIRGGLGHFWAVSTNRRMIHEATTHGTCRARAF